MPNREPFLNFETISFSQQPGEETEERGSLAERAAAAVRAADEEHEVVLEKYHRGISHVEGLLKLDKLRQVGAHENTFLFFFY